MRLCFVAIYDETANHKTSREEPRKESIVTSKKSSNSEQHPAKPDLSANYRPVGLKAVVAASLMAKNKPGSVKKSA